MQKLYSTAFFCIVLLLMGKINFAHPLIGKDSLLIDLNDTALHEVKLSLDTAATETLFLYGDQVTLYLPLDEFVEVALKGRDISNKLHLLKTKRRSNEIPEKISSHPEFEFVTDQLLEQGRATLFDHRSGHFVNKIYYRLETFDGRAERFYYLPDYRVFFTVVKLTAMDDQKWFRKNKNRRQNELTDREDD